MTASTEHPFSTPLRNSIAPEDQPEYPGDLQEESAIENAVRWNTMAMVVRSNNETPGIGGHISTFASCATLYEVALNHFLRGPDHPDATDIAFWQGHASPGNYARAFVEGRLDEHHLLNFRQDLAEGGGLTSYPHARLMPDFWQMPTVSMGLGPVISIYQARFNRYLQARDLKQWDEEPRVWGFFGDGEMDEPESAAGIEIAAGEGLNNLIWVINCNLQRLDGPVRGNGHIIRELDSRFRGAGWNVLKVVWGTEWDPLFAADANDKLQNRIEQAVDGDFQKYLVEPGSYMRNHFFGEDPELLERVAHLTDDQLQHLGRGGHDPVKIYAAYHAAVNHTDGPTLILAQTIKGHGLGAHGEAHNVTHQQKKLTEKGLRNFRSTFRIPLDDDAVASAPFYRPPKDSPENRYLHERRQELGGYLPFRATGSEHLDLPSERVYAPIKESSGEKEATTTVAMLRLLSNLLRDETIGQRLVPIIPDEARTFGMDALFHQIGIYSPGGQQYEPVDRDSLLYYRESSSGQLLEEGISEAGSMGSFIAAGTSYSTHDLEMIPMFFFYSMFGFQRVGDLLWAAGDALAKGFLFGATAGRTTLNGEGLQHQDGQSLLYASAHPAVAAYDPAFTYEVAVIIREGLRRMLHQQEPVLYYLTLYNEGYPMPEMPPDVESGILQGLYRFRDADPAPDAHLFASGPLMQEALRAADLLRDTFETTVDVWSATSYKTLRSKALAAERWNRLHPTEPPRDSHLHQVARQLSAPVVAVSDFLKAVPDQIVPWIDQPMTSLGTDGYGCSDTHARLRRFFEIDADSIVLAVLNALARNGKRTPDEVRKAIETLGIDPEKTAPQFE